jgi:agmatine/peptidylarginine deiminase
MKNSKIHLPAEWEPQDAIILAWPHEATDWRDMIAEAVDCYAGIARAILQFEPIVVLCPSRAEVEQALAGTDPAQTCTVEIPTNDTWTRDYCPIALAEGDHRLLLDFRFNGWGMKFPACHDNLATARLHAHGVFSDSITLMSMQSIVLEGGSIESDGQGTIMTTAQCLCSANRNEWFGANPVMGKKPARATKQAIETILKSALSAERILWIDHGHLEGDDTDGHIDTLARFCNPDTIAYVRCDDPADPHFADLRLMEDQLRSFRTADGRRYNLIPLPMAEAVYHDGRRLPATYANFLILNRAVLVPICRTATDAVAIDRLQQAFPDRAVIGVDCLPLLRQNGSLHCATMHLPQGYLRKKKHKKNIPT